MDLPNNGHFENMGISSILSVAATLEDPSISVMKTIFTLWNMDSYTEIFVLIDHVPMAHVTTKVKIKYFWFGLL